MARITSASFCGYSIGKEPISRPQNEESGYPGAGPACRPGLAGSFAVGFAAMVAALGSVTSSEEI